MTKLETFDESRLIKNPFEYTLSIPVTEVICANELEKDPTDGIYINKRLYFEKTPSIKLYYCDDCRTFVYNLSDKAQRLYLYILYNLKSNKDYIQINKEHYMNKQGIKSLNTYKEAEKELIRYNFILNTEYKTVFWINPNMFFAGNRVKKYAKNINVVQTWEK